MITNINIPEFYINQLYSYGISIDDYYDPGIEYGSLNLAAFESDYLFSKISKDIYNQMNIMSSGKYENMIKKPDYIDPKEIKNLGNILFDMLIKEFHKIYYNFSSHKRSDISKELIRLDSFVYSNLIQIVNVLNIYYPGYIVDNFDQDLLLRDYKDSNNSIEDLIRNRTYDYVSVIDDYNKINRFTGEDDLGLLHKIINEVGKINKDFPLISSVADKLDSNDYCVEDTSYDIPDSRTISIKDSNIILYEDTDNNSWWSGYKYRKGHNNEKEKLDYDLILIKYRKYFLGEKNNLPDDLYYWIETKIAPSIYLKNISVTDLYETYRFIYTYLTERMDSVPSLESVDNDRLDNGENILDLYYEKIDEMIDLVFNENNFLMRTPTKIIKILISSSDQKEE